MIKKQSLIVLITLCASFMGFGQSDIIISQYIETNSGTTPKGIEIFNVSGSDIDFSISNLEVYQGTNGASCSSIVTINSGVLVANKVWVIGTNAVPGLITYANANGTDLSGTTTYTFSFNGDDALEIYLGGVLQDRFGTCGSDPGTSWNGSGVSSANQNIQLLNGFCDGDLDGWTDPSVRFSTISTTPFSDLSGFGNAPASCFYTDEVDWCNLQSPPNGSMIFAGTYNVYAQVFESGITEAAGQGAGINAWIGYSTTNTNPSTWTNWVAATYNTDAGNNDEYIGTLSGLASGTYYYASRFQLNGGPYKYGGYNGGFWDGSTNVSGVLTVDQVDFCNLQSPNTKTIDLCENFEVYGQVYEFGVTDTANNQGSGIIAEVGYSTNNTNPSTWTNWISTVYNPTCTGGNNCNFNQNDEYYGNLGEAITTPGTYYYAMRYTLNSGAYSYGGILADGSAGGFWNGTNYISGILTVKAGAEIDIERSTNASIPSGSAATTGYNTVFASTTIGNTTAPKTYYIHNEGTSNLTINSLSSSNNTEFTIITPLTFPITIAPGSLVAFEIEFSPNSTVPNPRTSTITISNNDCNEANYTFNVQGTAVCAASPITMSPASGPVGTFVNVIGANFGTTNTNATVGGLLATFTYISPTEIEVTIPPGATTGSLEVTNELGCVSSNLFTVINRLITDCEGNIGTIPNNLFISEVTDKGTGSHTYIEIFNGTGLTVSLTNYTVRIHNNGSVTATTTIPLSGNIPNNGVIVIGLGGSNAMDPEGGYTAQFFSAGGGINENDHIRLYENSTWVDLWGDTSGNAFTITSKDYTYRRKNSGITVPKTTWDVNDWDSFTPVDYTDIGQFDFSTGIPPSIITQPLASSSTCELSATLTVVANEGYNAIDDSKELTYQWYYSAPGDLGWTPVSNVAPYSGATLATLNISSTLNLNGYQYYCQVKEDGASCYKATNAVRLDVYSTSWDGSSWNNGAPLIDTIAIIDGDYDTGITGDLVACNLIINSGYELNVRDNTYVKIQNNVVVDGTLIVQTHGAFVQVDDTGTFTLNPSGTSRVIKETALIKKWYEYTYWSSPVKNQTVQDAFPDTPSTRRFLYKAENYLDSTKEVGNNNQTVSGQDDIDDNGDDWQIPSGASIMTKGLGYAATSSQLGFFPKTDQATFEGAFHTGDIYVDIYRNDSQLADNNWNLIGNPYPSAINADLFLASNSVIDNSVDEHTPGGVTEGVIFFWSQDSSPSKSNNGNENVNFAQSDYAIINTFTETKGGDGLKPTRNIPSGQGFFISYANGAPGTLLSGNIVKGTVKFTNSMRMADGTSNSQFFRTNGGGSNKSKKLDNKLWVNLTSDNGVFNQIAVGYVDYATNAFDGMGYDTPRNLSNPLYSSIYTLIDGNDKKFAIQGKDPNSLNLDEVIPLGFDTAINEATVYTLSIENVEGDFLTSNTIYLKDNLLHKIHDLTASDYSFTSEVGEFKDRFEIVFQSESLSDKEAQLNLNKLTIIELNDGRVQLKTNSMNTIKSVQILDLLGRTLYQLKGTNSTEIYNLNTLSQSTYIAKVELSNGQIITKKAIKRN